MTLESSRYYQWILKSSSAWNSGLNLFNNSLFGICLTIFKFNVMFLRDILIHILNHHWEIREKRIDAAYIFLESFYIFIYKKNLSTNRTPTETGFFSELLHAILKNWMGYFELRCIYRWYHVQVHYTAWAKIKFLSCNIDTKIECSFTWEQFIFFFIRLILFWITWMTGIVWLILIFFDATKFNLIFIFVQQFE